MENLGRVESSLLDQARSWNVSLVDAVSIHESLGDLKVNCIETLLRHPLKPLAVNYLHNCLSKQIEANDILLKIKKQMI
jgi:hypothetical protein